MKNIYKYFEKYGHDNITYAIECLADDVKQQLYVIYGNDLENSVINQEVFLKNRYFLTCTFKQIETNLILNTGSFFHDLENNRKSNDRTLKNTTFLLLKHYLFEMNFKQMDDITFKILILFFNGYDYNMISHTLGLSMCEVKNLTKQGLIIMKDGLGNLFEQTFFDDEKNGNFKVDSLS